MMTSSKSFDLIANSLRIVSKNCMFLSPVVPKLGPSPSSEDVSFITDVLLRADFSDVSKLDSVVVFTTVLFVLRLVDLFE